MCVYVCVHLLLLVVVVEEAENKWEIIQKQVLVIIDFKKFLLTSLAYHPCCTPTSL